MEIDIVEFTNNQGERDTRMMKGPQKISGCFRSMKGAKIHSRIKSYLSTCQKHGVGSREALELLFDGKLPDFVIHASENPNVLSSYTFFSIVKFTVLDCLFNHLNSLSET